MCVAPSGHRTHMYCLLRELVKEGGLSEEVINDRVRDILRVKFLVGLFDTPYQTDLKGADEEVEKERERGSRIASLS